MKSRFYILYTNDVYETPVFTTDNLKELASYLGITYQAAKTNVWYGRPTIGKSKKYRIRRFICTSQS